MLHGQFLQGWFREESVPLPLQLLEAACIPWFVGAFLPSLQTMASTTTSPPTDSDPPTFLVEEPCDDTGDPGTIAPFKLFNLIPAARFLLPWKVPQSQVRGVWMWTSSGAITQPRSDRAQA